MKNFKNCSAIAAGLLIMIALLMVPAGKSQNSGIDRLIYVAHLKAQAASDEASRSAEKQRTLVKSFETLPSRGNSGIGGGISGKATDDNDEQQQPGRLNSREMARERAILQQLEAHARRSAEVLESVKQLAAEFKRRPSR